MKYIVDAIVADIENQIESSDNQLRIRLNDFGDVRIYESVCRLLHNKYDGTIKIVTRLSEEKWLEFKNNASEETITALTSMEDNQWIAQANSLTYYRNLPSEEAKVIVIMGTEVVDDQGGLYDCYDINPFKLYQNLEGDYSDIFISINGEWDEEEKFIINKLISDLFALIPAQICKLSDYADQWGAVDSIDTFVEHFFASLSSWGLCKWIDNIPSVSSINRGSKRNILQSNYDFITRKKYKRISKRTFLDVKDKMVTYDLQNKEYASTWAGWDNGQAFNSYMSFCEHLEEYVLGANLETNRELFIDTDFAIVKDVLDLKIERENKSKDKSITIKGNPLNAFLKAFIITVQNTVEEIDTLEIRLQGISLVDAIAYDNEKGEKEQLAERWKKLCCCAGGVFDFIKRWGLTKNGETIDISDPDDFLNPKNANRLCDEEIIEAASSNKKLNKVTFTLHLLLDGKTVGKPSGTKFEWCFDNEDTWTNIFESLFNIVQQWEEDGVENCVPLFKVDNYVDLLNASSEVEFVDILKQSSVEVGFDITTRYKDDEHLKDWYTGFLTLGDSYVKCCKEIYFKGFFACIKDPITSELFKLNTIFEDFGKKILGVPSLEIMSIENVLDGYTHAFMIEKDNRAIANNEYVKGCIVPPYHPATLQKLADKAVFIMDGCYQWLQNETPISNIEDVLYELDNLSDVQNDLDIFLTDQGRFMGPRHTFANYTLFGESGVESNKWLQNILQKEEIYDDDFKDTAFKKMNASANMIYDVLNDYRKALPNNGGNLSLAVIDPLDLQPLVAAVNKFVDEERKKRDYVSLKINVLVRPENKGGKNYLSYWINSYFSQDDDIDIKIYFNEWEDNSDFDTLLDNNLDIIFVMNILNTNLYNFMSNDYCKDTSISDCRYPMVFKPIPVINKNDAKRKIELSQHQFNSSYIHSQLVYYRQNYKSISLYKPESVIKEVMINKDIQARLEALHEKTNWVICVDSSMDGALLRQNTYANYDVIGFSTGRGMHGKYNLTITSRKSLIDAIRERLKRRLFKLFHWNDEVIAKVAQRCMDEAYKLDGVSLLKAINPVDQNIHEFLAYVLTSLTLGQECNDDLKVVIHLDSYKHWFENEKFGDIDNESCSRPDFLLISANAGEGKIKLKATVIECKMASQANADVHKAKAMQQALHGVERLSSLFDPDSKSIKRRYWFAQLYRALSFSEITFCKGAKYQVIANQLRKILDGEFEIDWSSKVMGYWLDLNADLEQINQCNGMEVRDIPQKIIQGILLDDYSSELEFVPYVEEDEDIELEALISKPLSRSRYTKTDTGRTDTVSVTPVKPEENKPLTNTISFTKPGTEVEPVDDNTNPGNTSDDGPIVPEPVTVNPVQPNENKNLQDVRVYLGKSSLGEEVYWEFGNPKLANRHLLITGTSGQGKTYCIQTLLKELAESGVSSAIFDYTEGFKKTQLEKEFVESLGDKIVQKVIYFEGVPINPFRQQQIEFEGKLYPEKTSDVAQRIANIFKHVYEFGDQQFSAVYEACRTGMEKYGEDMDMRKFQQELETSKNSAAKTVLSKMAPFINSVDFKTQNVFDWNSVVGSDGTITIFQLTNYVREIQVIITEMMLWDAWHYFTKNGNKNNPFVVVLDEAQNLSIKDNSPAQIILREGRKFGWSAWFATQSLKSLSDEEVVNLHQAPFSLYFKPTDDEIIKMAKQIDPSNAGSSNRLVKELQNLNKGQCIVAGDRLKSDGTFGSVRPTVTSIAPFRER